MSHADHVAVSGLAETASRRLLYPRHVEASYCGEAFKIIGKMVEKKEDLICRAQDQEEGFNAKCHGLKKKLGLLSEALLVKKQELLSLISLHRGHKVQEKCSWGVRIGVSS